MIAKYCPEYSFTKPSTLVAVSGSGNVAQYTALKIIELGATVLSLSDSKGTLLATDAAGYTRADVEAVIAHMDQVFTTGTTSQINALKATFGLQNVTHLDDVAGARTFPSMHAREHSY